ncbi:putative outer membrane protein precursor [Sphingomonas haloaromaticamans]|nr:putative outer membrane protein precursor [Sphingomonas haloaromaticamans]
MMKAVSKAALLSSLAALAVIAPGSAQAGGFYLQEQSVKGAGRAFSGEVADQGAASLWWNPASIGGLQGGSAHIGFSAILPKGDLDNVGTAIVRPGQAPAPVGGDQRSEDPINKGYLPTGAIAYGITPEIAVGLTIASPYSFTTNYDETSWARYTADKTRLRTYDIQPSIAVMPLPGLSLGAGLNIEYAKANLGNYLPNLSAALPDGHQNLKGDGWDLGWTLGAQYAYGPATFGVSYKSSVKHKLSGEMITSGLLGPLAGQNGTIATHATFRTPWQLNFGTRVKVTEALTLNGQVSRFGWGKFDAIRLGDPVNVAIPEHYRDTWSFAGGVDYDLSPKWTIRGGIQHDQTPTRNGERDARVPDSNRWNFALGTSYAVTQAFTLDAAANYIHFKDAKIDRTTAAYAGSPVQTPILVDGEINNARAIVLSIGGRLTF